ncbi:uncharacterized protein EHS24_000721 [Apiotrichum porosum]|uniref:Association with the SNF1 complex (ASC) domain-containing protein n=1 Tax=Apiotrichum porosum TaxID=105984 RepID=A0A427YAK6_9TREE|nr:uncharacterized protein EHS24_000721 [Apiotrichum porosum]RSH88191.1 hypothetical protein EHS24_000721 [Apiotrichum porosum]
MGNTPSHAGSPARQGGASDLGRSGSTSRRHAPNLRLPMPQRGHVSPQTSNPTSPSGARPGSPRRRKSLELPDLNKLAFTPAAPVPTTATNTSNHLANSTTAAVGTAGGKGAAAAGATASPPSTGKKWQNTLGGRVSSPLAGGLAPMSKVDPATVAAFGGAGGDITVVPVNDNSTYFPSQPIPIRSPRAHAPDLPGLDRPHPPSATRRPEVKPVDTPLRTGLTPPPPTVTATPRPVDGINAAPAAAAAAPATVGAPSDGMVDVPVQWNGGGKAVYVTGNFADNWRGRIKLKKSTHDFNTILRLPPGQYRLKFIVDESWRCSKAIPTATDDDGTLVNWIEVEALKTDAEMAAEWAMDSKPVHKAEDMDDAQWTADIPAPLVLYQYLEELPQMFPPDVLKQYVSTTPYFSPVPKPPQLPRILEKVILNSDPQRRPDPMPVEPQVVTDDNAILPTPNHTVLGHLMASAIKNGTLGVATSTRYRKKYCTTIFFRSSSPVPQDPEPEHAQDAVPAPAAAAA